MDRESGAMTEKAAQRQFIARRCFGMSFRDNRVTLQRPHHTLHLTNFGIPDVDVLRDWCSHLRDLRITSTQRSTQMMSVWQWQKGSPS